MWWGSSPPDESHPFCRRRLLLLPPTGEVGLPPCPSLLLAISHHLLPINFSNPAPLAHSSPLTDDRKACTRRTRILIADAQPLTRIGLYTLLSNEPDLEVVGKVVHSEQLESAIARLAPDLLILDVTLPELDAVTSTRHLVERYPQVSILILTARNDEELIFGLLEAGITGYALKEEPHTDLLFAIRTVAAGRFWLSSRVARMVVDKALADREPLAVSQDLPTLTDRELEVLALIGQGLSNPQIAEALCITRTTVRSHVKRINSKIGLDRRGQVVRYAIEHGLVSASPEE
jgi:DNA-binding NarL/FixJ family response regulator